MGAQKAIKKNTFWLVLSFAIGIVWSFLMMHFLIGIIGGLVYILIFIVIIPLCLIFYDLLEKGGRTTRITLLVVLIASGSFFGGLRIGLFESMSLAEGSLIDVSNAVIALHVRNTGLSPIQIAKLTIDNIDFNVDFSNVSFYTRPHLDMGRDAYLIIQYVRETFLWDLTPDEPIEDEYYYGDNHYTSEGEPTPLTFENGSTYAVTFHTYGLLQHSFPLKAKLTGDEELSIWKTFGWKTDNDVDIRLYLNNTATSLCYIYTIQIGDALFHVEPPIVIWPTISPYYPHVGILIHNTGSYYNAYGTRSLGGELVAEPPPTISMFQKNETYEVRVWTMSNNYYTTNVTIT